VAISAWFGTMSVVVAIRDGAAGLAFLLLAGFVSANVRRLAAEKGLDNFLLRAWDYAAAFLPRAFGMAWREKWWFWVTFGLSVGIAVSLWIVSLSLPTTNNNVAETTAALRTQIANLQAALDATTQQRDEALRRAGMTPAPPPVVFPPTADEIRTKLSVWKNITQLTNDLARLLDQGDAMLDAWSADAQDNQSLEATKAHQFAGSIYNFRLKLESTHDSLAGNYADIAELLREAVRSGGRTPVPGTIFDQLIRSSETFADELSGPANSFSELRDRVDPSADILRKDLQAVRNWGQRIIHTATVNGDALAKASK
jgi:hypothetical protein